MKRLILAAIVLALLPRPAAAQEAAKPGPQHKRLGYFAGSWEFTGEAKASPMGPGGAIGGSDTCEWFPGGFQMVCRGDATGPRGSAKTGSVWTWDPMQEVYTLYGFSSMGEAYQVTGTVDGAVWTWKAEFPVEGATMRMRATITEEPPAAYSYKLETSTDGTTWIVVEEGRATKKAK